MNVIFFIRNYEALILIFTVHSNNEKRTPREMKKERESTKEREGKKECYGGKEKRQLWKLQWDPFAIYSQLKPASSLSVFSPSFPSGHEDAPLNHNLSVCACVCVGVWVCGYVWVCGCVCMCVCMGMCVWVCMYGYVCVVLRVLAGTRKIKKIDRKRCSES